MWVFLVTQDKKSIGYCGDKSSEGSMSPSVIAYVMPDKDISWYELHIYRFAWNPEHKVYMSTDEWWGYFGNGYYPN